MAKDWSKHSAQHFQGRETMSKPSGHDKELSDSDRAHSGQPGAKVKHGMNTGTLTASELRRKAQWHIDRAGSIGNRRLAEEYTDKANGMED